MPRISLGSCGLGQGRQRPIATFLWRFEKLLNISQYSWLILFKKPDVISDCNLPGETYGDSITCEGPVFLFHSHKLVV